MFCQHHGQYRSLGEMQISLGTTWVAGEAFSCPRTRLLDRAMMVRTMIRVVLNIVVGECDGL